MIKLIACDLDGTVFDDHKNIDSDLKEIVDRLREKGIEFTVVSGRSRELLRKALDHFQIDTPFITNNGADIFHGDECICIDGIPKDLIDPLCHLFHDSDIVFRAYSHEAIYKYGESDFFSSRLRPVTQPILSYDPETSLSDKAIIKITGDFIGHEDLIEPFREKILSHLELDYTRAEGLIYCVNSATANKGTALQRVCEYMRIDIRDTMAFGDSENDLEMLKKAGIGVAMANGEEKVRKEAAFVCGDNNHNGVSAFLKDYFKELL